MFLLDVIDSPRKPAPEVTTPTPGDSFFDTLSKQDLTLALIAIGIAIVVIIAIIAVKKKK